MEEIRLIVPKGITYISEWKEYSLEDYQFPHILNKTTCGCGFTEYCLTNDLDVILCSPRKILLENKKDQHGDEVYFAKNNFSKALDFEKDFSSDSSRDLKPVKEYEEDPEVTPEDICKFKEEVRKYVLKRKIELKPSKILVTYDSFRHVKEALEEARLFGSFVVSVDEFQSILVDAAFKSTTENEFLRILTSMSNRKICYVSATPLLGKYLAMIPEFKDLPYYRLDWETEDPSRVVKPELKVKVCKTKVTTECNKVVQSYLNGEFEEVIKPLEGGRIEVIKSKEAVLYVNSVKAICRIIKKNGLTPDNTNVLCAKTERNRVLIQEAFRKVNPKLKRGENYIGKVPKKGEEHKMFTLCTRTVYLGADFYSTCARTFIFSDANVNSLAVDISMDLPQILGRQRLTENPWKNSAELFLKTNYIDMSEEEFNKIIQSKVDMTNKHLSNYQNAEFKSAQMATFEAYVRKDNYRESYLSINYHAGKDKIPVPNELMKISDMRAFEVQKKDYKDRFTILNVLGSSDRNYDVIVSDVDSYMLKINKLTNFTERLRYICELGESLSPELFSKILSELPVVIKGYYTALGPEKLKSLSYQKSKIVHEYSKLLSYSGYEIYQKVHERFKVGDKIPVSDLKESLQAIFDECGKKDVKVQTKDIERWFTVKIISMINKKTGVRERGVKIISDLG